MPDKADDLVHWMLAVHARDPALAQRLALSIVWNKPVAPPSALVFASDLLLRNGRMDEAFVLALRVLSEGGRGAVEGHLALANVQRAMGDTEGWHSSLSKYWVANGAELGACRPSSAPAPFWFGYDAGHQSGSDGALVSVIMTAFNAASTLVEAVESVLRQQGVNLELIVVDDVSTDSTRQILEDLQKRDGRVIVLRNDRNSGTYASKNRGIRKARGDFITFHDSDDWMHPRRLAAHRDIMTARPDIMCSTSLWVRMDREGHVLCRAGGEVAHLNPASTFLRRSVFDDLGGFDEVRTGADAEFLARCKLRYGPSAVLSMNKTLGIGLHHLASLTQSGVAAYDEYRFSPVRLAYSEAWFEWHVRSIERGSSLHIAPGGPRPFELPKAMQTSAL